MQLRTLMTALSALTLFAVTATAQAQDPEAGDTGQWQQPNNNGQQQGWGQPNGNGGQPPQGNGGTWNNGQQNNGQQPNGTGGAGWNNGQNNGQQPNGTGGWQQDNEHAGGPHGEAGAATPATPAGPSDYTNADNHAAVLHHLGVGFFGIMQIPIGAVGSPMAGPPVAAPTIGMRYWINDLLGFEAALAIGFASLSNDTTTGTTTSSTTGSAFGMGFHVGLPLAIAHWQHFAFILEPEVQLAFSTGSQNGAGSDMGFDDLVRGFLFQIGGRIGAEIHFGFIGVPQLALQAGVGLHLAYSTTGFNQCHEANCPNSSSTDSSTSVISLGTSIANNPWDIFTGAITAIYYL